MHGLDWGIVAVYLAGMIGMSAWIGRRQRSGRDYYLAGNRVSPGALAISTMATQCSTNSLLGAPAFVIAVGGLAWLQYELAVPLAMIGVMVFLLPFFRKSGVISVYEYLERRFGPWSRTALSLVFQFLRAFSTGVTVYGIAIVIQALIGVPFWQAVLLLGVVTVVYDFLGGIRAVIISDVVQMAVLYAGMAVCLVYALRLVGGWAEMIRLFPDEQARVLDFGQHGLGDGGTFSFWPMLLGGFFLYLSYYGCDQTQVQRELSSKDIDGGNLSLFLNGILRFPLVLTYCLVGVAIGAYAVANPEFVAGLTDPATGEPNYNLAVPLFSLRYLPVGVVGLIMVSLFAAAMSSLDSTINSLSALTMRDVIQRFFGGEEMAPRRELLWSRLTTLFWGVLCVAFSFYAGRISGSVIESVNMIGSLANGPILAVFLLAILTRRTSDGAALAGMLAGLGFNGWLWLTQPGVSWLWWNVIGCVVTFGSGWLLSLAFPTRKAAGDINPLVFHRDAQAFFAYRRRWPRYYAVLLAWFILMLAVMAGIQALFVVS